MATLSSGDTLSLANLRDSSAASAASISSVMGSTPSAGDNISFSSFAIDSVGSLSGFTYGVENTSETYTLSFNGAGSNHDAKLAQYAGNFTWSVAAGSTITIGGSEHKSATVSFSDRSNTDTRLTVASNTLRVVYDEPYNGHATGLNTNKDKTVYNVDNYDGHASSLCLTADSPILLADGTIVDAGDLEEGDVLKGYSLSGLSDDEYSSDFLQWSTSDLGETAKNVTVVNLTYSFASRYYDINGGEITGTSEHPMLVKDSTDGLFRFKELHSLVVGDKLIKSDNGTITEVAVSSIDITEGTVEIVSIDVEEQDTYLVNGYITHNKGTNTWSDFTGPSAPTITYNNPAGAQNSNLSWTTPTATGTTGVTDYDLQVDNNSDFSSLDATHSGTFSTTSLNVSGLSTGTWYARVRAREMGVYGAWSSTLTFSHTFEN
jgi:hypothetical protein